MSNKKTVRDWLNELPEPIRTRALDNLNIDFADDIRDSIESALFLFADWLETKEGGDYWYLVNKGNYSEACALLGETLVEVENKDGIYELPQNAKPLPTKNGEMLQTECIAIESIAKEIISKHPQMVNGYNSGKKGLLGFFVGEAMKMSKGKLDAKELNKTIIKLLEETLQTEQTEPDNENELLQSVKDKLAFDEYGAIGWFMLSTEQEAHLVDKVAIRYAELINQQKQ